MENIGDKIIAFLPCETIEAAAMRQIENTASVSCLFRHVAVMPDTHYGRVPRWAPFFRLKERSFRRPWAWILAAA